MRDVWRRLGRDDAINAIVVSSVVALQFVGSFITATVAIVGREWLFAACSAVSVAAVALMFVVGKFVVARLPERCRPGAVLVVFQSAALVRAIMFDTLLLQLNFIESSELAWRVYGSQSNVFLCAIVVSSLVTMARDYSERNSALVTSISDLQARQDGIDARATERKAALIASIRQQFDAAISRLDGVDPRGDSVRLRALIDDVVRPLSHRLGRGLTATTDTPSTTPETRISWSAVVRRALSTNPFHPVLFTLWLSLTGIQVMAGVAGAAVAGPFLITVVFMSVWFLSARLLWPMITGRSGLVTRGVIFTVLVSLSAPPLSLTAQALTGFAFFTPRFVLGESIYVAVICWAITLVAAVRALLRHTNAELTAVTSALSRRLITENLALRHFEAGVSRVLHGPVQDAVAASIRRLQNVDVGTLSAEEWAAIRQPIDDALTQLDEPPTPVTEIDSRLASLVALWSGVVEISVDADATTLETLRCDSTTASAVLEIMREAVSNAIRHGDAQNITVALHWHEGDIVIDVVNDGRPVADDATPGIGTLLLEEWAVTWSRSNTPEGVQVSARVPLTQPDR